MGNAEELEQKRGNVKKAPMEIMGNAEELEQTYGIERKTPT